MADNERLVAAVDAGTECVKAVVVREGVGIVGRSVVSSRTAARQRGLTVSQGKIAFVRQC